MLKSILLCFLASFNLAHAQSQVTLHGTILFGRSLSSQVEFFGGIPYAEPPLGNLRFRPPVLKTRIAAPSFNATSHGKGCLQYAVEDLTTMSEDCLTVSIWKPTGASSGSKLPILFWTYGGGFSRGSSSKEDGTGLVTRSVERGTPIIYVSFNHRMGPLGFPQGQEADDRRALNLGIQDQTAALQWVQANVHFFGGDPSKVTAFGSSSGSIMLGIQALNPLFSRLVRGIIFQSGQANSLASYTAAEHEPLWQNFVGSVPSCANTTSSEHSLPCLRNSSTEEITRVALKLGRNWTPAIDRGEGSVFSEYASRVYREGRFARVPFIAGTNLDEGTHMASQEGLTDEELKVTILDQNGPAPHGLELDLDRVVDRIMQINPDDPKLGSPYGTGDELFGLPSSFKRQASQIGDMIFTAPRRYWSQSAALFGVKSYAYHFTHPDPQGVPKFGVTHGEQNAYIHGRVPDQERGLSTVMMDYWISFVVSLDPNDGKGLTRVSRISFLRPGVFALTCINASLFNTGPLWPEYTKENNALLQLEGGNTMVVEDAFRGQQNAFLVRNTEVLRR
ncbi:hypothetical protein NMY22_g3906 [Coprinellus aureogranulatus]|nr:hypothetical protein NMY22_g3906 [Coprinellus aureogranulatus]